MLDAHAAKLTPELNTLAESARAVAQELERGQATCPLSDSFQKLATPAADQVVKVLFVGLSPETTSAALSRLLHADFNVCRVVVPSKLGYTEVHLQERGFSLETGAERAEFEDVEAFVGALQEKDLVQAGNPNSWLDPLRLELKAPTSMHGLCLLIPDSLQSLQKKPALLSTLADQADWVVLAGTASETIDARQRGTLQLVLDQVVGLQCIRVPGDAESQPAEGDPWWKGWTVTLSLGLVDIDGDQTQKRLEMLTSTASPLRKWMTENRRHLALGSHLQLLDDALSQNLKQLGNRRKLQSEGLLTKDDLRTTRSSSRNTTQQLIRDDFEALRRTIEETGKRNLLPGGTIATQIDQAAHGIQGTDIEQTEAQGVIKLGLAPHALQNLQTRMREIGRRQFREDFSLVQETLETSVQGFGKSLSEQSGFNHKLSFALPDSETLWRNIEAIATPQIRYKGEMPIPTLGSRLSAARQVTMPLMIAGMMIGGAATFMGGQAGSVRPLLYAIMLPLFVFGFFYTYVSFRRKEEVLLEKEVEKLGEGVQTEMKRNLSDLFREERASITQELAKIQRDLEGQIQDALAKAEQRKRDELQSSRESATANVQAIDRQVSQWTTRQRELQRLATKREQLGKSLTLWLGDWINAFNRGTL